MSSFELGISSEVAGLDSVVALIKVAHTAVEIKEINHIQAKLKEEISKLGEVPNKDNIVKAINQEIYNLQNKKRFSSMEVAVTVANAGSKVANAVSVGTSAAVSAVAVSTVPAAASGIQALVSFKSLCVSGEFRKK